MQGLQCSGLSHSTLVGPTRLPTISSTSQGTPPPSVSFLGLRSSQSNLHGDGATSISLKQISQKNVLLQIGCGRLVCNAASSQNGNDGSQTEKMIVAITGATGFIGSKLVKRLAADGHEVRLLTRSASKARSLFPEIEYPSVSVAEESLWAESIQGSTGVVNLAGPPISTRWTPEVKADLKNCRLAVTAKVVEAINSAPKEKRPAVLVSSTAVGFYGTSETSAFDETSPSGKDYLAEVCKAWEAAARRVSKGTRLILVRTGIVLDMDGGGLGREWEAKAQGLDSGTRLVLIRTGIVLDKDGGALGYGVRYGDRAISDSTDTSRIGLVFLKSFLLHPKDAKDIVNSVPYLFGKAISDLRKHKNLTVVLHLEVFIRQDGAHVLNICGGPLGSGKQWLSWVHRDDLVSLIMESLQNPAYEGVINGTAPNPVRMTEMCDRLGNILGRPSWLPVPEFALKAIFGEGASVVLEGQRVLPKRAQELGFSFKYRYISDALKAILTA